MVTTTETILSVTPNKRWNLVAIKTTRKIAITDSSTSFKITNGIISDQVKVKRANFQWRISYTFNLVPKYVRIFVARYFAHWFTPMQIPL
jgi:hypothetical protein